MFGYQYEIDIAFAIIMICLLIKFIKKIANIQQYRPF